MVGIHTSCKIKLDPRPECDDVVIMSDSTIVGWLHWEPIIKQWMVELDAKVTCSAGYLARVFEKASSLFGGPVWEKQVGK